MDNMQEIRLDPRGIRPQERERDPLSGELVTIRSHGGSLSFRGKEYKPDKNGLIKNVPIEAVREIESGTYWLHGREPYRHKLEIVETA